MAVMAKPKVVKLQQTKSGSSIFRGVPNNMVVYILWSKRTSRPDSSPVWQCLPQQQRQCGGGEGGPSQGGSDVEGSSYQHVQVSSEDWNHSGLESLLDSKAGTVQLLPHGLCGEAVWWNKSYWLKRTYYAHFYKISLRCPQNVSLKFQLKIPHRSFIISFWKCPLSGSKSTPFSCMSL